MLSLKLTANSTARSLLNHKTSVYRTLSTYNLFSEQEYSYIRRDMVRIFPIPADGRILVETPSFSDSQISLFDLSGKHYLLDVEKFSDSKWQFDTSALPNGMYLLKLSNGEQQIIKRIIIQH